MDRNYISIIAGGSAGLLVIITIIVIIVIVGCRKKRACCLKVTTPGSFKRTASDSSGKHIRVSALKRETHLIDNDVSNENVVSTFQTETMTVSNEIDKSAGDSRSGSQIFKQECDKESESQQIDTLERNISKKPANKIGDGKKKTDKCGLDGCDNFALTVENDEKETAAKLDSGIKTAGMKFSDLSTENVKKPLPLPAERIRDRNKENYQFTEQDRDGEVGYSDYITPVQIRDAKQHVDSTGDYDEIMEQVQHSKSPKYNGLKTACDTRNVKIFEVPPKNDIPVLEKDKFYDPRQFYRLNIEMKGVIEQRKKCKKSEPNSTADDAASLGDDDSLKFSTNYIKLNGRDDDTEHVYSSLIINSITNN